MNSADNVISSLVTSIRNLENNIDALKADLESAKEKSRASSAQKLHNLPVTALTGDLKVVRDRNKNIHANQHDLDCQRYGTRAQANGEIIFNSQVDPLSGFKRANHVIEITSNPSRGTGCFGRRVR